MEKESLTRNKRKNGNRLTPMDYALMRVGQANENDDPDLFKGPGFAETPQDPVNE